MKIENEIRQVLARRTPDAHVSEARLAGLVNRAEAMRAMHAKIATGLMTAALVVALVGVTVLVPRLGGGTPALDFVGPLRQASSVRFTTTAIFHHGQPIGDQPGSGSEGLVDLDRRVIHIRNDVTSQPTSIPFLPPAETISTPTHIYYLIPDDYTHPEIPASARWLQVEPGTHLFARTSTNPFDPTTDPVGFFETIQRAAAEIDQTGATAIGGVPVDRYDIVLDVDRMMEDVPSDHRPFFEHYRRTVAPTIPMIIWIGQADQLPYRVSMTIGTPSDDTKTGFPASITSTTELFDYDLPVNIRIPSGDEVFVVTDDFDPDPSFGRRNEG